MDVLGASEHTHSPQRVLTSKHVEIMATAVPVCVLMVLATVAIGGLDVNAASGQDASRQRLTDWNELGQRELKRALQWKPNMNKAKNVIFFLGDGMGPTTVTAARFYLAQSRGKKIEETGLAWEDFPAVGLSKTYNVDRMTPDSAGTATAYLSGVKTNYAVIGLNANVKRGDCSDVPGNAVNSVLVDSKKEKWTGVVTNMRVTHATPAGAYAYTPDRNWESSVPADVKGRKNCRDIATQLIDDHADIRVILGGGRNRFLPASAGGKRNDNRNLIEEWAAKKAKSNIPRDKYAYVKTKAEMAAVDTDKVQHLFGLFNDDVMAYEYLRVDTEPTEPSVSEMTETAIRLLQHSDTGYFLLVEGGKIDYCHHENLGYCALNETVAMSDAVRVALRLTSEEDTLVIVTADHSHVMTMGGYPSINNDIAGLIDDNDDPLDNKPMLTLMYADGPGYKVHRMENGTDTPRMNLTNANLGKGFVNDAGIHRKYESHGGEDVGIYARGPMSHLIHGVHEQSYIAHVMRYASCVGENREHCEKPRRAPGCDECAGVESLYRNRTWIVVMASFLLTRFMTFL